MEQHRRNDLHKLQPPPPQKCPRCDSSNTKFCYYNNYSLSQPRYFCKACRRYWTHGGTLRNVPVGGGGRKSKRPKPSTPDIMITRTRPPSPPRSLTATSLRPLPPIISSPFHSDGSLLTSLAAMQSLFNQGAAVNLGGGIGQYEANKQLNDQYFPPQQSLRPSPTSWTQSFNNRGPATTSAASSSFWSAATAAADGSNQAGSSSNRNHWQDSNLGFDPSSHT